jgi:hypothetical protein
MERTSIAEVCMELRLAVRERLVVRQEVYWLLQGVGKYRQKTTTISERTLYFIGEHHTSNFHVS